MSGIEEFAKWVVDEATPADVEAIEADLRVAQQVLRRWKLRARDERVYHAEGDD
jgi:hypothetical protein